MNQKDLTATNEINSQKLTQAIATGKFEIVDKFLIESEYQPTSKHLSQAISICKGKIAERLLEAGCNPPTSEQVSQSIAANNFFKNREPAKAFFSKCEITPKHFNEAINAGNYGAIDIFIELGHLPTEEHLTQAIQSDNDSPKCYLVNRILESGCKPTSSHLSEAIRTNRFAINPLLKFGCKPDENHLTLLLNNNYSNNFNIVKSFIEAKCKFTPKHLTQTIEARDDYSLRVLLDAGCKPSRDHFTLAMQKEKNYCDPPMCKALINSNCQALPEDLSYAIKEGEKGLFYLFLKVGRVIRLRHFDELKGNIHVDERKMLIKAYQKQLEKEDLIQTTRTIFQAAKPKENNFGTSFFFNLPSELNKKILLLTSNIENAEDIINRHYSRPT